MATSLLARYLGSEELGEFSAVFAYHELVRDGLRRSEWNPSWCGNRRATGQSAGSIVRTGVMLMTMLCVATAILALCIAPHAGYRDRLLVLVAIATIETLIAPLRLPGLVFQVDLQQWYGVGINVIRQGLWLALIIALREYHAPLTYVVGARIVVATVEALLIWFASRRFFSASSRVLWHKAPHYLKESFPSRDQHVAGRSISPHRPGDAAQYGFRPGAGTVRGGSESQRAIGDRAIGAAVFAWRRYCRLRPRVTASISGLTSRGRSAI